MEIEPAGASCERCASRGAVVAIINVTLRRGPLRTVRDTPRGVTFASSYIGRFTGGCGVLLPYQHAEHRHGS